MPFRRTYRRRAPARRRRYRKKAPLYRAPRRRRAYGPRVANAGVTGKKMVKFRYVDEISIDPASGAMGEHLFRANSMFDPDVTGGGHQPMGFDQQMNEYEHFVVTKSFINVQFMPNSTTQAEGLVTVNLCSTAATTPGQTYTSLTGVLEAGGIAGRRLRTAQWGDQLAYSPTNPRKLRAGFNIWKTFGKGATSTRNLWGQGDSDPIDQTFYAITVMDIGGNNPGAIRLLVTIEYTALLFERVPLVQS